MEKAKIIMKIKLEIKNEIGTKTIKLTEDEFYLVSHLIERSANRSSKVPDENRIDKKLKATFLQIIEEMF